MSGDSKTETDQGAQAQEQGDKMSTNPYGNIGNATGEGRFPFFSTQGRYVCALIGWKARDTRNHGPADFADFKILKVLSGGVGIDEGSCRTRMRTFKGDSAGPALEEVKQRALVAFQAKGMPMASKDVTAEVMMKIAEADGGVLQGAVFVVEIGAPVSTKTGKTFSPANYFVATAKDLEGVDLG
jgi:hypothetical protein